MSATLIFGRFFQTRKSATGKSPRIRGTVSAPEGMGQLIETWRVYLEKLGVQFRFSEKVDPLKFAPEHPYVIATSVSAAAEILSSLDPSRAKALKQIEVLPLITATVGFAHATPVRGFGCLFPPVENRKALGVLMNESIFPNRVRNGVSETWILGGSRKGAKDLLSLSDDELLRLICDERSQTLGADRDDPVMGFKITRWPKALPHYTVEVEGLLKDISEVRENVFLIGNYLGRVGLAKILEGATGLPEAVESHGAWKA